MDAFKLDIVKVEGVMERLPRQSYIKEYREQAVKLVTEEQLTIPAARCLSMSHKALGCIRHVMVS
jgi:hypothetical protein